MLNFCGWYGLVLTIVAVLATLGSDKKKSSEKMILILINLPILYYFIATLVYK